MESKPNANSTQSAGRKSDFVEQGKKLSINKVFSSAQLNANERSFVKSELKLTKRLLVVNAKLFT